MGPIIGLYMMIGKRLEIDLKRPNEKDWQAKNFVEKKIITEQFENEFTEKFAA